MLRIFIGADPRQAVSLTTIIHSITARASKPVAITPLVLETLPITRQGLTPFTWSRFLVPHLCDYRGWALFLDADILCKGDIAEVFALGRDDKAVHVMQQQPLFEWASMILFNCGHPANAVLTPEHIDKRDTTNLHKIGWLDKRDIGELPLEWNVCVPYSKEPSVPPKLLHYTQGVPFWWETANGQHAEEWIAEAKAAIGSTVCWWELMGRSVHRDSVLQRLIETGEVADFDDYARKIGLTQAAE